MPVARDDDVGADRQSTGENSVVIGIFLDHGSDRPRKDDAGQGCISESQVARLNFSQSQTARKLSAAQYVFQLQEEVWTGEQVDSSNSGEVQDPSRRA